MTSPHRDAHTVLVDDQPVRVLSEPVLLVDLDHGDWFIGPSGELYEVTRPASEHPNRWTEVTNLSMPVETERALRAESGGSAPAAGPREGFFSFPRQDVIVDRVLELVPAIGQAPGGGKAASVLGALTARWVGSDRDPGGPAGGNAAEVVRPAAGSSGGPSE